MTSPVSPEEFADRLAEVRRRVATATDRPESVRLVAVTKGFDPTAVAMARRAGLADLGENYADELVAKAADAGGRSAAGDGVAPQWHFLGAIQRNKVARLAPVVSWWHGLQRSEEARAIVRRSPEARLMVQVDYVGTQGRSGLPQSEAAELVRNLQAEGITVAGLMTVGPPGSPSGARTAFRALGALADELGVHERSMGMTDDLEVAVEEGSTMIRIGRALFGARAPRSDTVTRGGDPGTTISAGG